MVQRRVEGEPNGVKNGKVERDLEESINRKVKDNCSCQREEGVEKK